MKKVIDALIPRAYQILQEVRIADHNNTIDKTWRSQIASFGSSIKNGSLLAAVAFFSDKGGSQVAREKLMIAIWLLLHDDETIVIPANEEGDEYKKIACKLYSEIAGTIDDHDALSKITEQVINASIALKLAMNLYILKDNAKIT